MHRVHHKDLATLLEVARPRSVLLLDPTLESLPQSNVPASCQITRLSDDIFATLPELGLFDLGIIANTLEHLERKEAGVLLARLRDVHTRRFVALVPLGKAWDNHRSHWHTADLLGYGMTVMARYREADKPLHLYHYAIESYKTTPNWFNNQHWAHPERWRP
ncbi:MAG: DUF6231 family protein [Candidatus Competibacteraceae bacterium]|jgi:hypothetical protein|nr:DUF6231 family protein [Candidatus Competibacteraceae bacterium]